ncbi:LOW QUALITY PROTEIN: hypothetical protein MC885_018759, partial [Smutsia gigantea]
MKGVCARRRLQRGAPAERIGVGPRAGCRAAGPRTHLPARASRGRGIGASGRSAIRGRDAGRDLGRGRHQRRPRWAGTVLSSGLERGPEREHDGKVPLSLTGLEPFRAHASLLQLGNQTRGPSLDPGNPELGRLLTGGLSETLQFQRTLLKAPLAGEQPTDGLVCPRGGAQGGPESGRQPRTRLLWPNQ